MIKKVNYIVLTGLGLITVFAGCKERTLKRDGVSRVYVYDAQMLDACMYRYTIRFSDDDGTRDGAWYWVGLKRINLNYGGLIVARSTPVSLQPPVFDQELSFEVTNANIGTDQEEVVPVAYRTKYSDWVYDLRFVEEWAEGEYFNLPSMPEDCCDLNVSVASGALPVSLGSEVYIDVAPTMPGIQVTATSPVSPDTIDYELVISYIRSGRNDWDTVRYMGPAGLPWDANAQLLDRFRGGQAEVKCRSHRFDCTERFAFCIRANNPDQWTVENMIASYDDDEWFWRYIAMQESDSAHQGRYYAQFNTYWNNFYISCDPTDSRGIEGTPNASGDGGFGIFQLTGIGWDQHPPGAQALWSWRANVDSAAWWLRLIAGETEDWMYDQRLQAMADHGNDPGWFFSVPDDTVGNVVFSEDDARAHPSPNTIENAVAMKRYNGSTNGFYCYYDNFSPIHTWRFSRLNAENPPRNYVAEACSRVPPNLIRSLQAAELLRQQR